MANKRYVVYENTLKGIFEASSKNADPRTGKTDLYKYEIYHEMDSVQRQLQNSNQWQSNVNLDIGIYTQDLEKEIEEAVFKVMLSKSKGNVEKEVYDTVMNSKISACVGIVELPEGYSRVDRSVETSFCKAENNDVEYIYNTKEFEDRISKAKLKLHYTFGADKDKDFIYVENVKVQVYDYRLSRLEETIPKIIKKTIKHNLTYCLKNGVNIVPDEYLDRGKAGINEWRELKSSSNKNNSMEKRLLKQVLRDRKEFAFDCVHTITRTIASGSGSWTVPKLEVDGRYNKTRTMKLVNELLKDKNKQEIMELDNETILSMVKEYWKTMLMEAYQAVDNCKTENNK